MYFHTIYDRKFYEHGLTEKSRYSVNSILPIVIDALPSLKSVIDVGCGIGMWLHVLKKLKKLEKAKGIDGEWVARDFLLIPEEDFIEADFSKEYPNLSERFDLAISLEVAEHLPAERARGFVNYLTTVSDFVLFSAAIPFQGGTNHVNEQFQDFWAELFEKREYTPFDIVRPRVWSDEKIKHHYKQNIILYVHKSKISEVNALYVPREKQMLSIVHPHYYSRYVAPSIKRIFWKGLLRRSLKRSLRRIFGRLTSYFDAP